MSASVNRVTLIGNLGRDPEVRYYPDGTPTATISLATSETWKDKQSGEKREATEWHRVVFVRNLAEVVGEYLESGNSIYVEGKLKTRKWTDKDGLDHYITEIQASRMQMLGASKRQGDKPADKPSKAKDAPKGDDVPLPPISGFDEAEDDIPF